MKKKKRKKPTVNSFTSSKVVTLALTFITRQDNKVLQKENCSQQNRFTAYVTVHTHTKPLTLFDSAFSSDFLLLVL